MLQALGPFGTLPTILVGLLALAVVILVGRFVLKVAWKIVVAATIVVTVLWVLVIAGFQFGLLG